MNLDAPNPGVKSEDIEATLNQETRLLKISAQLKVYRKKAYFNLTSSDRYQYEIPLAQAIDLTRPIEATCKEGILTIALNKNAHQNPVKFWSKSLKAKDRNPEKRGAPYISSLPQSKPLPFS